MHKYTLGEIYLVRFHPSVGSELKRYRPAVIVSSRVNEIDKRFTLIAPLSTNIKETKPNYELQIKSYEFLDKESAILAWYLKTVDVVRLEKKLGQLGSKDNDALKVKLRRLI